jgi:predicted DNA-binding protein
MEFQFRPDREAHLRKLCEEMGRSVDDFVNEAVLTFMEDYEDGRDAQIALEEGGQTWTREEMEREFALDNRVPERHQKTA